MGVVTTYVLRTCGRRKLCILSGTVMTLAMSLSGYFIHTGSYIFIRNEKMYMGLKGTYLGGEVTILLFFRRFFGHSRSLYET